MGSCIIVCTFVSFYAISVLVTRGDKSNDDNHKYELMEKKLHKLHQLLKKQNAYSSKPMIRKENSMITPANPGDCVPRFPLLTGEHVHQLLKLWFIANCPADIPKAKTCKFASIGQFFLNHAIKHDMTLLTVQIGAMDGKSNDPMYEMFVSKKNWWLESHSRDMVKFQTLQNWLPVLLEPVPDNFRALVGTYKDISEKHDLPCAIPMNAAVSYSGGSTECAFCRFNLDPDAPEFCTKRADWMKTQIGTLDCEYSRKFFGNRTFDACILKDPLPCAPIGAHLKDKAPFLTDHSAVAMVQIDVEAYEYILIPGLVKELKPLPPVIHFEHKVMKELDRKQPLASGENRMNITVDALTEAGYQLYEEGEDTLAFLIPSREKLFPR
jgi:hypothetical protein